MFQVRKGVIIAAGLGTRFLPATKAMPKEMLPVLDKPVVQYIVEEMMASGIREIVLVTSAQKRSIEDHFDRDRELENFLKQNGKLERLKSLIDLSQKVRFFYTRQSEPLGNGHALLCAREFVGDEPFAFSDGDSIIDAKTPVIKQLLSVFSQKQAPIIGVQKIVDRREMMKYGNVYVRSSEPGVQSQELFLVDHIEEKPALNKVSPEGLVIGGMRYILTRDIWSVLEKQKAGRGKEIWVADAVNALAKRTALYAYEYEGKYFDTGDKLGLLKTAIHFAMKDAGMKKEIKKILKRN